MSTEIPPDPTSGAFTNVVFQGVSGLPKDRFVNTFHWNTLGSTQTEEELAAGITARLSDFYIAAHGQPGLGTTVLGIYLNASINRLATINTYFWNDPEPRTPHTSTFTLPGALSTNNFPSEVALCGSYKATHGNVTGRQRGRIYIGPLNGATQDTTPSVASRPSSAFINTLVGCMAKMMYDNPTAQAKWCILSRGKAPDGKPNWDPFTSPVETVWVDNAFDTQRRRGEAPNTRVVRQTL